MEFNAVRNSLSTRRRFLNLSGAAGAAGLAGSMGLGALLAGPSDAVAETGAGGLAATMGMAAMMPSAMAAPQSDSIDYLDPRDNLYAFGKVWGTYGDKPVFGSWHGILFASVGSKRLRPLFGYTGFGSAQCKITPEGYLQLRAKEGNFYTDLATGEVLETWYNPYTEENVEVFTFMNDRVRGQLTFDMPVFSHGDEGDEATLMNEATARRREDGSVPFIMPFEQYGSKILLAWDYRHEYTNPVTKEGWPKAHTANTINPSEHFVFFIDKDELEDRDVPSARFHSGFTRISPFWPWMRMGGSGLEDGKMMGRSHSYQEDLEGYGNIPPKLLDYVEKHYPDYLEPCDDWDDGQPMETWQAYAERVPPENPDYTPPKP